MAISLDVIFIGCDVVHVVLFTVVVDSRLTLTPRYHTGQFVMEGFIKLQLPRWKRVLITRSIAICPTIILAIVSNNDISQLSNMNDILNILQSLMLPFALLPILQFTSDKKIMGWCKSPKGILAAIWTLAFLIFGINIYLVIDTIIGYNLKKGYIALVVIVYIIYSLIVAFFLLSALRIRIPLLNQCFPAPVTASLSRSVSAEPRQFSETDRIIDNEYVGG